jgi:hypothetical protein
MAVVLYACDEMMKGDFLAAFKPEPLRTPDAAGMPVYEDAAEILFADAGQLMGVPRRLMVIDKGIDAGFHVSQRLTVFRQQGPAPAGPGPGNRVRTGVRRRGDGQPSVIGDAVVVAIRADSATIRIEGATDAIASGDWAAPQQSSPAASPVAGVAGVRGR